jgi:hypothetical protein
VNADTQTVENTPTFNPSLGRSGTTAADTDNLYIGSDIDIFFEFEHDPSVSIPKTILKNQLRAPLKKSFTLRATFSIVSPTPFKSTSRPV